MMTSTETMITKLRALITQGNAEYSKESKAKGWKIDRDKDLELAAERGVNQMFAKVTRQLFEGMTVEQSDAAFAAIEAALSKKSQRSSCEISLLMSFWLFDERRSRRLRSNPR